MKKEASTNLQHWRGVYGILERMWLGVWALLLALVVVNYGDLGRQPLEISIAMFLAAAAVPQVTARLGRMPFDVGRMAMSVISAYYTYEFSRIFIEEFRSTSYELEMIIADAWLFGGQPSVWLEQIASPWVTEYLQFTYVLYFPLLLFVGVALLVSERRRTFTTYLVIINLSLFTCHFFYFLVPLRSPLYIMDDPAFAQYLTYDASLNGLWFAGELRQGLLDATTMRYDAFPSGHTMHTLLAILFAWKANRKVGVVTTVIGVSIIFSTLYLRYHYAVDLIAGAVAAGIVLWVGTEAVKHYWDEEPRLVQSTSPTVATTLRNLVRWE
ncbi:MAG: phosphatase PAP2 family protein [Myxococcota bacterium]